MQAGDLTVPGDRQVRLRAAAERQRVVAGGGPEQHEPVVAVLEREERLARALGGEQRFELGRRERVRGERVAHRRGQLARGSPCTRSAASVSAVEICNASAHDEHRSVVAAGVDYRRGAGAGHR